MQCLTAVPCLLASCNAMPISPVDLPVFVILLAAVALHQAAFPSVFATVTPVNQ